MNATHKLAAFAAGLRFGDLPQAVAERTKIILLDTLASALAGLQADESGVMKDSAAAIFGAGDATVIGGGQASAGTAVVTNGYLVTAATVCDIHRPTICHVTPEVIPPALIVAERLALSGEQLLCAIALGLEVTTRVGNATGYDAFRKRGWHAPGVFGPFGGAAAVCNLYGCSPTEVGHAFGIALSQAAGTWAQLGTPTIKFQQSRAALSGLLAAELAHRGFTSTDDALGVEDGGLFFTYGDGGDPELAVRNLGQEWQLNEISLRPWPVAAFLQPVVTVALRASGQIEASEIEAARLTVGEKAYELHGAMGWDSRFRARLSSRYVTAVSLIDGECWMEQFAEDRVADPAVTALAERIVVIEDPAAADSAARLTISGNGREVDVSTEVPKGDAADPLTLEDVQAKFFLAADPVMNQDQAEEIANEVAAIDKCDDVSRVIKLLGRRDT